MYTMLADAGRHVASQGVAHTSLLPLLDIAAGPAEAGVASASPLPLSDIAVGPAEAPEASLAGGSVVVAHGDAAGQMVGAEGPLPVWDVQSSVRANCILADVYRF